jgi:hypothetical protein
MRRIRYKDLLARNSHLSYEDLVALVSDEASLDAGEKIRKHLDGCWHCQARHQQLKESIVEIVQNLNAYVGDLSSRARIAKCRLDQDLQRLAVEKESPAPFTQVLEMLESKLPSRYLFRQLALVAVCVLALLAIFPLTSTAPISAAELLQRSKQAEQQMMETVPDPAIHGMFRVTKKSSGSGHEQSMTWEIWEDMVHNRVRNRVESEEGASPAEGRLNRLAKVGSLGTDSSPLLTDLQQVCLVNGIDIAHPLSPDGFDNWRHSLRGERDEVFATSLAAGDQGMSLRTIPTQAPTEGRILSAELIVRSRDWHPVEQRFTVQGATATQEYDVVETAYQVVALESAPASIFAEVMPPVLPATLRRRMPVIPAVALPTPQQLDEAEISAKFALYRVDEFLRGQIRIAQNPAGSVQIEGMVETEHRKSELTSLLASIPYTAVKLRTSEEALNDLQALPDTDSTALVPADQPLIQPDGEEVKRNQAWVQSQWNRYGKQFQDNGANTLDQKMVEISNQAIAHMRAASFQAWALRRLAQDYPRERVRGMSAWSQLLLEMMVQDHARLLGVEIGQLNSMVNLVLMSFAATGGAQKASGSPSPQLPALVDDPAWQRQVELLFQNVDDINEQVLGVFGNVDLLRGSAEDAVNDLLRQLPKFNGDVQDFEQQVGGEFMGVGESPALKSSLETIPK